MDLNQRRASLTKWLYFFSGTAVFSSALFYYFLFRSELPWPGYLFNLKSLPLSHLNDITNGTYPSFAFTLSIGLIAIALFNRHKALATTALFSVWAVGLLHEITLGTFSSLDVVAGTAGALIPLAIIVRYGKFDNERALDFSNFNISERLKLMALVVVSGTLATGTSAYEGTGTSSCLEFDVNGTCVSRSLFANPVYMSYAELRSAVKMSGPREQTSISRIYLYENMIFMNERNEGIHIIDNRFPTLPETIGFIEIPGNTEISIRDNNLYADSYIDLVTLDLSNIENVTEIARQESIFPYNARQNIPDNIRLNGDIDSENGVVVGYQ